MTGRKAWVFPNIALYLSTLSSAPIPNKYGTHHAIIAPKKIHNE